MSDSRVVLQQSLASLEVGAPHAVGGLVFRPLLRREPADELAALDLLEEALAAGAVEVAETDHVAELVLRSRSERRTLVLEGEIVAGGRQNRLFNQTFVLAPQRELRAPTSCVERGRWSGEGRYFSSPGRSCSPSVSSVLRRSVSSSLRRSRGQVRSSDQRGVWDQTASTLSGSEVLHHDTEDLLAAYKRQEERLRRDLEALRPLLEQPGLVGIHVARPAGAAALEVYATPRLARRLLERLLTSHLLQAGEAEQAADTPPRLEEVLRADLVTAAPGLGGVGEELRLEQGPLSASAFLLDGRTIHLGVDWAPVAA